jgi:amidase
MLTRSVRDTALLLDLCQGSDAGDGYEIAPPTAPYAEAVRQPQKQLKIALCTQAWSGCVVDSEGAAAARASARKLESLGHAIEEDSPRFDYAAFLSAQKAIWAADSAASLPVLAREMGRAIDTGTLGASVLAVYRHGLTLSAADLMNAVAIYDQVTRELGRFLARYDVLLTPTAAILPEPIGTFDPAREGMDADQVFADLEPKESFTALFNATGQPAISVPAGLSRDGLPIGIQLAAGFGREDILLGLARKLEQEFDGAAGIWGQRRPSLAEQTLEQT